MPEPSPPPSESPAPPQSQVLGLLICPVTRSPLVRDGDWLVAQQPQGMGLAYPIENGLPIMLPDRARLPEGIASLETFTQRFADIMPNQD